MVNGDDKRREALLRAHGPAVFLAGRLGLEREGLRLTPTGHLAPTPHPAALGSPLTHPYITTDYAEPLLELITPPLDTETAALAFLERLHRFVHVHLGDELIWPYSMPCCPEDEGEIPLAQYGRSNLGLMKTVYRHGLGLRYGRKMQIIAGVHFNFSMDETFWRALQALERGDADPIRYRSEVYLGQLRNLQRLGWLIPYLFGASPAVCRNFMDAAKLARLQPIAPDTLAERHATSLRVGDIGYQNRQECASGFKAVYNDLDGYIANLTRAITTPCEHYTRLGVRDGDRFLQLNDHILQIENEYYASVRPKPRLAHPLEMPVRALASRGVAYVELRALDLDPDTPIGVTLPTLRFLRLLLLHCLLADSPPIEPEEAASIDRNLNAVAHRGRAPGLVLESADGPRSLRDWGLEIIERLVPLARLLDAYLGGADYRAALDRQRDKLVDPDRTPAATILRELETSGEELAEWGLRRARAHHAALLARPLAEDDRRIFNREAEASIARSARLERAEQPPFERFLNHYFSQLDGFSPAASSFS